jgi:hypothetical protein
VPNFSGTDVVILCYLRFYCSILFAELLERQAFQFVEIVLGQPVH